MAEAALADDLAAERSRALRILLGRPLVDIELDVDDFHVVVRHGAWLTEWFEATCGWSLVVDAAAGFARLAKRSARVDVSRPLRRTRGSSQPFDRRRYQVLCLVCAELVRHPVTTVGILAGAVGSQADLDTSRKAERSAFVDALLVLSRWGVVRVTAGDVESFLDDSTSNALLTADTARLHRLLTSAAAPSTLPDDAPIDAAIDALLAEPRYGEVASDPDSADWEQKTRWVRHTLARRLLDDPVTYLDALSPAERDYLANPAGRKWLRDRVAEAGFELEERLEGLMAVDPEGIATDQQFPAPAGNAHQLALLLIDELTDVGENGERMVGGLAASALRRAVDRILGEHPGWARSHREGDGPDLLARQAVDLLEGFGLVRRTPDGTVVARPALARYRSGEPVVSDRHALALFEDRPADDRPFADSRAP